MSIEQIIEMLLQHGSLGIFAGYLIFECSRLRKQQDSQVAKFESLINKIRDDSNSEQSQLRDRYDKVITDLQNKENSLRDSFTAKVTTIVQRTDEIEKKVDLIGVQLDSMKNQLREIRIKDIAKKAAQSSA